ncbi:GbsR/MarR family transcriptional regulator [Salegentibacter sp. HM20]
MSHPKNLETKKAALIEKLGVHLEDQDQLAPLAARIYASLILTGKSGQTFDELVQQLQASKSTVCTHLNALQTQGRVSYFTKTGDRKRYFIVAPNRLHNVIDEMTKNWNRQKEMHLEILEYKSAVNETASEENSLELDFHKDYLVFLEEAGEAMRKLKLNIIKKQDKNEAPQ